MVSRKFKNKNLSDKFVILDFILIDCHVKIMINSFIVSYVCIQTTDIGHIGPCEP